MIMVIMEVKMMIMIMMLIDGSTVVMVVEVMAIDGYLSIYL